MSKAIPQILIDALKEVGLTPQQATWDCHGTPVVLHKALERIAAHKGIVFDAPNMIDHDVDKKTVVICVQGHLKDKTEWSFGEAAPYNNKNAYPFSMAEKRAKDRVILKLLNVAGFVYSQEEAEDFSFAQFEATVSGKLGGDYFRWKKRIQNFKPKGEYEDRDKWEYRADQFLTEWRDSLKAFAKEAEADEEFPSILIQKLRELYDEKKVEMKL